MILWLFFIFIAAGSLMLTGSFRRYALARSLMDIPNERSSHCVPTPRGGGAAIVLCILAGLIFLKAAGYMPASFFWALLGAGTLVAIIGWTDDRKDIPARIRLAGHFIAAGWALFWLGGLPQLSLAGMQINPGLILNTLALLYLVWLLNLYNFMDGIDGIAGIEAITVCAGGVALWLLSGGNDFFWTVPVLAACAAAGFLFWNFPKARIFMGDAGSGFLGILLGVLSIQAAWISPELFWAWLILLGAFIVDATITLLRRIWRREKFYQAHRSHAYQHAARKYGAHWPVSLAFGAINLLWLLPVAALVTAGLVDGIFGLIIAYVPIAGTAILFNAGKPGK
ncbi:MAG: glycosyltransferase family 4 protein [Desulfobacteraceae bacterium]|nr:glycosyltransferase family 4 protein [Desulfobacteraceae bacterium]